MAKSEIRQPCQIRSIEKKKKIAEAGYKLFCEKGFYHTNTNEIAKEAGVSTGIVYHYFKDKKSILMAVMDQAAPKFNKKDLEQLSTSKDKKDIEKFFSDYIDKMVHMHEVSKIPHEEFQALRHSDSEIAEYMNKYNDEFLNEVTDVLISQGFSISHIHEKVDIIYHLIDQYSESLVLNKRDVIDYKIMKKLIIDMILNLF